VTWQWLSPEAHLATREGVVRAIDIHGVAPSPDLIAGLGPVEHLTGLSGVTNGTLEAIGHLTSLRELTFSASPVANDDGLAHFGALSRLEILSIVGGCFVGDGLEALVEARSPLKLMRASNNRRLGDDALLFLGELGTLEDISLSSSTHLGDEGLRYLGDAETLRRLSLSGCRRVGDRGVEALGSLPALTHLDLSFTAVIDRGVAALGELPLERLALHGCSLVTDASAEGLARLASLVDLDLGNCSVSPGALQRLRLALPGTRVRPAAMTE